MWWVIGLLVVIVVLGLLIERRRRASGSTGEFTGEAPFGAESAAVQGQHRGGPGLGYGGGGS
ncbi:hypothetical protein [Phycicoccus avicenniae]|uniref:hypothetical protein n=1 Tax=Phycicoccus avicenniae TaxID=2828860 RepID=UPI003D2A8A96